VHVPGDDIGVAVADRNERLVKIVVADTRGTEQTTMGSAGIA
jgi:hypothetical protein